MGRLFALIFCLMAGIANADERAPFRLAPAEEWNHQATARSIDWLTTRGWAFRTETPSAFTVRLDTILKKAKDENKEVLTAVVSYGDFARYYWLINPKLSRVGDSAGYTRISASFIEAVYGVSPNGDETVYYRNDLVDQDASADYAFKLSRDFPGIYLHFKRSDGGIHVFLPGDLFNSTKEGLAKRLADTLR